jgi:N-acetylglucosamine-6-sulfatase
MAPPTERSSRAVPALAAALAVLVAFSACGEKDEPEPTARASVPAPPVAERPKADPHAPNVVVLMVDDQSLASFKPRYMPRTFAGVVRPGTRLATGIAAPPLCCPARAGFLTGQYPHNHGVFSNSKGYLQLSEPEQVLPAWLQRAGYVTGFVGKPLNGYNRLGSTNAAPGFDHWYANFGGRAAYYDYDLSVDGEVRHYGTRPADYMTDVLSGLGLDFVTEASKGKRPFFLWLAQYAPHRHAPPEEVAERIPSCANSVPTPKSEAEYRRFADEPLPKGPAYDEADVSDKQGEIANLPRLDARAERFVEERWRCTLAALRTLDRTVGGLVDHLRELGELDDTVIVYLSDNGYFFGEHRLATGKGWFYPEASEVPFAIRVPPRLLKGAAAPARSRALAANIDLAPTILDFANAEPCIAAGECREPDGRSLRGLLTGEGKPFVRRAALLELESGCEAFEAIRTERWLFSVPVDEHPERCELAPELYDLRRDPAQLDNLAREPRHGELRSRLAHRLNRLTGCAGTTGPDACE